jgi:hypothetical protein
MKSHPWFPFYAADWLADPALRTVGLAARGAWIEILCLIYQTDDRGRLSVAGNAMTPRQLARAIGADLQEVEAILDELRAAGVCDVDDDGAVVSRRMRRDMESKAKRAAGGHLGAEHGIKGAEHGHKGGRPRKPTDKGTEKATDRKTPSPPGGGFSKTPLVTPLKPPSTANKGGYQSGPENKAGIEADGDKSRNRKPPLKPPKNPPYTESESESESKTGTGKGAGDGRGRTWKSGRGVGGFMPQHLEALGRGDPAPLLAQVATATGEKTRGFRSDYDTQAAVLAHGFDALAAAGSGKSPIGLFVHRLQKLGTRDAITPSDESQTRAKATMRAMTSGGLATFAHAAGFGSMGSQADVDAALRIYGNGGAE